MFSARLTVSPRCYVFMSSGLPLNCRCHLLVVIGAITSSVRALDGSSACREKKIHSTESRLYPFTWVCRYATEVKTFDCFSIESNIRGVYQLLIYMERVALGRVPCLVERRGKYAYTVWRGREHYSCKSYWLCLLILWIQFRCDPSRREQKQQRR